jgi:hypothetical protein
MSLRNEIKYIKSGTERRKKVVTAKVMKESCEIELDYIFFLEKEELRTRRIFCRPEGFFVNF